MADAFRGLTIRLGADARPLQSAISSITRSAAQAQTQLSKLNKALKFDSTNAAMMQSRIDLMGDKAQHSARAVAKISTAMKQATSESGDLLTKLGLSSSKFKDMARNTREVYAATQKVRDELYSVDASLQHIYDSMAQVAKRMDNLGKSNALAVTIARLNKISDSDAVKYLEKLREQIKAGGDAAKDAQAEYDKMLREFNDNDAINYIKKLKEQTKGTGDAVEAAKAEFKKLFEEASKSTKINELFGQQKGQVKELEATYKSLIEREKELSAEQRLLNSIEGFRAMKVNAQLYRAELRQAVSETARLKSELYALGTGGRLSKAVADVKLLDEATEKSVANARKMVEAYRAFPNNLDATVGKIRAVAAAQSTLEEKIKAIKSAMAQLRSDPAFDKLAADSKEAYVKAMEVESKYTKLASSLKVVDERATQLKATLKTMDENGADKTSAEYKNVAKNIELAENAARELKARLASIDDQHAAAALVTEYKSLETQLAAARTEAAALRSQVSAIRSFSNFGKGMREFGFGMYASVTPALMMAGRYAVQVADEIDAAYRDMRKTVNGTDADFEKLKESAIEFSKTHVTSADQVLEIEAIGGQLGVAVSNLEAFATTVANLDIATNMDAEDIATTLGKMASVMGLNVEEYDNFGDALVRLGNNMPVMESDIMNLTARYMGMGKVVGMTAPEMLAWSAAASATGQKAEAAGSSMQRFISNVETAVNAGGETLDKWASVAGMSASKFAREFGEDASAAMYAFVEGLGKIQKEGGSVNQTLKELGINNVRDKQLMEGLANQMANAGDGASLLAQALQMSTDAYEGLSTKMADGSIELAGDAAREAEKKSQGFSGELAKMQNNAAALAMELGEAAAPILHDLGKTFNDLTNIIRDIPDDFKRMAVDIGIFVASMGPAAVALGTLLQSFEKIAALGTGAQTVLTGLAAKLNTGFTPATERGMNANLKFQKVLNALGTTKGLAGLIAGSAAIKLIVDAISDAIKKAEDFKTATDGLGEAILKLGSETASNAIDRQATAMDAYALAADRVTEKQARVASEIDSLYTETESKSALAQHYLDSIHEAQENYDGSADAAARLQAAVDGYNSVTGDSITITDKATGTLSVSTAELDRNAAAWKANARAQAASTAYSKLFEQQITAQSELEKATRALDQAWTDYYTHKELGMSNDVLMADLDATVEAQKQVNILTADYEANAEALAIAEQQLNGYTEKAMLAKQTTSDFAKAFEVATDGERSFGAVAMQVGLTSDDLSAKLAGAGVSADKMALLSTDAFVKMYRAADGNIELIANLLDELDRQGIDPKEVKVDDNGTISTTKQKLGSITDYTIPGKTVKVYADTSSYDWDINKLVNTAITKSIKLVTENAAGGVVPGYAKGAMFNKMIAAIPMHASGSINGIVTRPTMTNVGLTGEAGDEAILHMRHAGGAIIPLSNRQHVRPFARAVAEEMPGGISKSISLTVNLDYKAGDDAQAMARDIARELENLVSMEA